MSDEEDKQKEDATPVKPVEPAAGQSQPGADSAEVSDAEPVGDPPEPAEEADPWGAPADSLEAPAASTDETPEEPEAVEWGASAVEAEPPTEAPADPEPAFGEADPWGAQPSREASSEAAPEPEPTSHLDAEEPEAESPWSASEEPTYEPVPTQSEMEAGEPAAEVPDAPAATVFAPRMGPPAPEPPAAAHDAPAATVFVPSGASAGPAYTAPPPSPPAPDVSAFDAFSAPPAAAPAPPPQPSQPPQVQPGATMFNVGRVEIGTVLNDNYQIKRLIARGGMGEVYEGFNIHNERERVAIKVILPALAADPNVMSMFFKEAGILSGIEHPAVVGYLGMSKDQKLNVFYMVTRFIDGVPLGDMLARLKPTSAELRALTRRLAEGLRAAHNVGAIHRDISPDNVLLPGGRIEDAKVIDFGIAKDMDPSKATIVGDGFAGKLGYVAPEQFGDFDRQIGAWTDIYSLGLVILTVAAGKNIDMGATLVDAVDKRRAGPDLSPIPADLKPILQRMLEADPAKRFRSMSDLLAALDGAPLPAAGGAGGAVKGGAKKGAVGTSDPRSRLPLMIGGGVAAALVLVIGLVFLLIGLGPKPSGVVASNGTSTGPANTHAEQVRRAIETALPTIPCSWVDIERVSDAPGGDGVEVKLSGVAGSTSAVQAAVNKAITATGAKLADSEFTIAPVNQVLCSALDGYAPFRAATSVTGKRLKTQQASYAMSKDEGGNLQGKPVVQINIGDPSIDLALVGIQEDANKAVGSAGASEAGASSLIFGGRQQLTSLLADPHAREIFSATGNDGYSLTPLVYNPGWSGVILITGKGPFDEKLLDTKPAQRDAAWRARLLAAAQAGGWKVEMVWFQLVPPAS